MPRLQRVSDDAPGIRRRRRGKSFSYHHPDGRTVSSRQRRRIEALVIPPAWKDVWICPDPRGHIQATGIDSRGRKQYLYHPAFRRQQEAKKFDRLAQFGQALPALRDQVQVDLGRPGMPREKVLAAVVRIMERSFIRVGSQRYVDENESYGASTLQAMHVRQVTRRSVRLRFPGKGGKEHDIQIDDPRVAAVVRRCMGSSGQRLFEFQRDDGSSCGIRSDDVNDYLRDSMDGGFTSKDLRTWMASTLMFHCLEEAGPRRTRREREAVLRTAVKVVAKQLHNTPAVCRRSYIHPLVGTAYMDGSLEGRTENARHVEGLWPEEQKMLALLASYEEPAQ